jgi:hypothetical protein
MRIRIQHLYTRKNWIRLRATWNHTSPVQCPLKHWITPREAGSQCPWKLSKLSYIIMWMWVISWRTLGEGGALGYKDKTHRRQCKMSSSIKIELWRDIAAGVYLSEAQKTCPSPLYTLYKCIQYVYLFIEGRGESWTREKVRGGNSSQSWVENTNMTDCICSL